MTDKIISEKKANHLYNYGLTLLFVVLILFILLSVVLISRYVFSDVNPIGEHVLLTKDLLDDIDEVKTKVQDNVSINTITPVINTDIKSLKIGTISYYNIGDNRSFFSVELPGKIEDVAGYYYLKFPIENITLGDVILYEQDNMLQIGKISGKKDEVLEILKEDGKIIEIQNNAYYGIYLTKKEETTQ